MAVLVLARHGESLALGRLASFVHGASLRHVGDYGGAIKGLRCAA
jgi:hypothetical protein